MLTLDRSASLRDDRPLWNDTPFDAEAARLDADAELACRTLSRQIWLLCRNASEDIRRLGRATAKCYRHALSTRGSSEPAWRKFVRAVWIFIGELDRYPSQSSPRWRDARGALSRIVYDNLDLLEDAAC